MNLSFVIVGFFQFVAYYLIFGFLVNYWIATHPDSTLGKSLAFITS